MHINSHSHRRHTHTHTHNKWLLCRIFLESFCTMLYKPFNFVFPQFLDKLQQAHPVYVYVCRVCVCICVACECCISLWISFLTSASCVFMYACMHVCMHPAHILSVLPLTWFRTMVLEDWEDSDHHFLASFVDSHSSVCVYVWFCVCVLTCMRAWKRYLCTSEVMPSSCSFWLPVGPSRASNLRKDTKSFCAWLDDFLSKTRMSLWEKV
jgi:hypothetical protein